MDGGALHRWRYSKDDVFPEAPAVNFTQNDFWRRVHLFENGDLLAVIEGIGIFKLDADSNLLWANAAKVHHDLEVMPSGEIYVLTREAHLVPRVRTDGPVLEDFISILDAQGREQRRFSLIEAFERSNFQSLVEGDPDEVRDSWLERKREIGDVFHTNTLAVLDGSVRIDHPAFVEGNILVSLRVPDVVAVVDPREERVVWALGGDFRRQHDPKLVSNGNLMLFDNLGLGSQSRVTELDPASGEVRWEFRGSPEWPFLSESCGTAERLPGGTTLITESDGGRAFEVTREGDVVWEFLNPHRAGDRGEYIATLFEMQRLPADFPIGWAHGGGMDH